jgi:hypothetical protein
MQVYQNNFNINGAAGGFNWGFGGNVLPTAMPAQKSMPFN